jgi:hypothetical protein
LINFKCLAREFGCYAGECIPLEHRCDGVPDCENSFDEKNCNLFEADSENYRKELEPHQRNDQRTNVWINIRIFSVGSIDETDMTFSAKFLIELEW